MKPRYKRLRFIMAMLAILLLFLMLVYGWLIFRPTGYRQALAQSTQIESKVREKWQSARKAAGLPIAFVPTPPSNAAGKVRRTLTLYTTGREVEYLEDPDHATVEIKGRIFPRWVSCLLSSPKEWQLLWPQVLRRGAGCGQDVFYRSPAPALAPDAVRQAFSPDPENTLLARARETLIQFGPQASIGARPPWVGSGSELQPVDELIRKNPEWIRWLKQCEADFLACPWTPDCGMNEYIQLRGLICAGLMRSANNGDREHAGRLLRLFAAIPPEVLMLPESRNQLKVNKILTPIVMMAIEDGVVDDDTLSSISCLLAGYRLTPQDFRPSRCRYAVERVAQYRRRLERPKERNEESGVNQHTGRQPYLKEQIDETDTREIFLGGKPQAFFRSMMIPVLSNNLDALVTAWASGDPDALMKASREHLRLLKVMNLRPPGALTGLFGDEYEQVLTNPLWLNLLVQLHDASQDCRNWNRDLDAARLAIAAARYRSRHQAWPHLVQDLVPVLGDAKLADSPEHWEMSLLPAFKALTDWNISRPEDRPAHDALNEIYRKLSVGFPGNPSTITLENLKPLATNELQYNQWAERFRDYAARPVFYCFEPDVAHQNEWHDQNLRANDLTAEKLKQIQEKPLQDIVHYYVFDAPRAPDWLRHVFDQTVVK